MPRKPQTYATPRNRIGRAANLSGRRGTHRAQHKNRLEKDLRALAFLVERVAGRSLTEIATAYRCHPQTVKKYIDHARDADLLAEARAAVLDRLLPLALATFERHLTEGNLEAAQGILSGVALLRR